MRWITLATVALLTACGTQSGTTPSTGPDSTDDAKSAEADAYGKQDAAVGDTAGDTSPLSDASPPDTTTGATDAGQSDGSGSANPFLAWCLPRMQSYCLSLAACCGTQTVDPKCTKNTAGLCTGVGKFEDFALAAAAGKLILSKEGEARCDEALALAGKICAAQGDAGLWCLYAWQDPAALGQPCVAEQAECAAGAGRCESSDGKVVCVKYVTDGAPCQGLTKAHCRLGSACGQMLGKPTCQKSHTPGGLCGSAGDVVLACQGGQTCTASASGEPGVCVEPKGKKAGEACTASDECAGEGATCDKVCRPGFCK